MTTGITIFTDVVISFDESQGTYTAIIGPDPNASWLVSYSLWDSQDYINNGYYNSDGETYPDASMGTTLAGGSDYPNAHLELLLKEPIQTGLVGDINDDQVLNLKDVITGMQILVNIPTSNISIKGDIDNDKRVGLQEIIYDLKKISELGD